MYFNLPILNAQPLLITPDVNLCVYGELMVSNATFNNS